MQRLRYKSTPLSSWGITKSQLFSCYRPERQSQLSSLFESTHDHGLICRGAGLSYGDQSFNRDGAVILTERLNRFIDFNPNNGELICEPGVNFFDILQTFLPHGWMPAVIPGSLYVTVGGAIANDIHGKNNSSHGSFGHHVKWMELYHQTAPLIISAKQYDDLFKATLGGLGLTGLVSKACIQLIPATGMLTTSRQRVNHIEACIEMLQTMSKAYDYCSAWLDLSTRGNNSGRGLIMTASMLNDAHRCDSSMSMKIPISPPFSLINRFNMRCFNYVYYHSNPANSEKKIQSIVDFNNPLDRIHYWNKVYGKRGLLQLQCLLPFNAAIAGIHAIKKAIDRYHACAALCVIKIFKQESLGLLSFPSPGVTIAIDFPNSATHRMLIKECESIVADCQGKIYLAKDAMLEKEAFQQMYPQHEWFSKVRKKYGIGDQFRSQMSQRLGITR